MSDVETRFNDAAAVAEALKSRQSIRSREKAAYERNASYLAAAAADFQQYLVDGAKDAGIEVWGMSPRALAMVGGTFGRNVFGVAVRDGRGVLSRGLVMSVSAWEPLVQEPSLFTFEVGLADAILVDGKVETLEAIGLTPALRGSGSLGKASEWVVDWLTAATA